MNTLFEKARSLEAASLPEIYTPEIFLTKAIEYARELREIDPYIGKILLKISNSIRKQAEVEGWPLHYSGAQSWLGTLRIRGLLPNTSEKFSTYVKIPRPIRQHFEIPNYRVIETLKWQGHAYVLRATSLEDPSRRVAIKVFPVFSQPSHALKYFYLGNNFAIGDDVASLPHLSAALVTATHSGHTLEGHPFIVMDDVVGKSLRQINPGAHNLDLAEQLLQTVSDLHVRGWIHGDLKPENILVPNNTRNIRLIDFDSVRRISTLPSQSLKGTFVTDGFAPPEYYKNATPNPQFDVFGLGATLYFMLTGKTQFMDTRIFNLCRALDGHDGIEEFLTLEHEDLPSKVNPALSSALDQMISSALAINPKERFEDATQLLQAFKSGRR